MGRPRLARHPKPEELEPENENQEPPESELTPTKAAAVAPASPGKVNKAEAIRQALAKGLDDLDDIESFLKSQYDITMPRPQISAYKAQAKARDAKKNGAPAAEPKPRATATAAPKSDAPISSGGDIISDIEAVRKLIDKHGKDGLKRLADALG